MDSITNNHSEAESDNESEKVTLTQWAHLREDNYCCDRAVYLAYVYEFSKNDFKSR